MPTVEEGLVAARKIHAEKVEALVLRHLGLLAIDQTKYDQAEAYL